MKKLSINTLSNTILVEHYKRLLCKTVGYYANGIMHSFVYSQTEISLVPSEDTFVPQILIIAREYYQEKLATYPIEDKKELAKFLALEFSSQQKKYQVVAQGEGSSQVNVWQFKQELPKAKIIVPESFVLAQSVGEQTLLIQQCLTSRSSENQCPEKKLYISLCNQGVVSTLNSSLINTPERFCNSVGLQVVESSVVSTAKELPLALIKGVINAPIGQLLTFSLQQEYKNYKTVIKAVALPVATIFTCYLGLSSGWLYWQHNSLQQKVASQKADISQALSNQDEYVKNQTELMMYNSFLAQQQAKSLVWLTLASIIENVQVRTLRYADGRYIILGRTYDKPENDVEPITGDEKISPIYKSTDFLEKLIQQDFVVDAKFDSSVRRSRNYESFTVSFLLDTDAVTANNATGSK